MVNFHDRPQDRLLYRLGSGIGLVSVLVLRFCALKLIFKLISIADCVPSFELVCHRKYSKQAIFTATLAVKIAEWLFLRQGTVTNTHRFLDVA